MVVLIDTHYQICSYVIDLNLESMDIFPYRTQLCNRPKFRKYGYFPIQNTALVDKKLQTKEFTYDYSYWSADSRDSHFVNQEQVSQLSHYTSDLVFNLSLFML